jgi:hypothetical protein
MKQSGLDILKYELIMAIDFYFDVQHPVNKETNSLPDKEVVPPFNSTLLGTFHRTQRWEKRFDFGDMLKLFYCTLRSACKNPVTTSFIVFEKIYFFCKDTLESPGIFCDVIPCV